MQMRAFYNAPYLLLAIGAMLTALHVTLVWKSGIEGSLAETTFLCWASVWYLVWQKHDKLPYKSSIAATSLGLLCIVWVLFRSLLVTGYDAFLRFAPLASAIGLVLLASGFALKQFWRELLILSLLTIPTTTLLRQIDISQLTADFSGTLMWCLGIPVSQQNLVLFLPNGSVEVYWGCSGIQSIWQLITLSFLFLMLFPLGWLRSLLLPIAGVLIAFIVNGIRVVLMAILVNQGNRSGFDYWHHGQGSLIFSMIAVGIFGGLCYWALEQADNQTEEEVEA